MYTVQGLSRMLENLITMSLREVNLSEMFQKEYIYNLVTVL